MRYWTLPEQPTRTEYPHPSVGGTEGYQQWYQRDQVQKFLTGQPIDVSLSSIYRWLQRIQPYRKTGNTPTAKIVGIDQMFLALFVQIYPDGNADHAACFLYNNTGNVYYQADISRRMRELKITRKRVSTEAYQAHLPVNILKAQIFWSQGPPVGVYGVRRFRLVDFDEFGIDLEKVTLPTAIPT